MATSFNDLVNKSVSLRDDINDLIQKCHAWPNNFVPQLQEKLQVYLQETGLTLVICKGLTTIEWDQQTTYYSQVASIANDNNPDRSNQTYTDFKLWLFSTGIFKSTRSKTLEDIWDKEVWVEPIARSMCLNHYTIQVGQDPIENREVRDLIEQAASASDIRASLENYLEANNLNLLVCDLNLCPWYNRVVGYLFEKKEFSDKITYGIWIVKTGLFHVQNRYEVIRHGGQIKPYTPDVNVIEFP